MLAPDLRGHGSIPKGKEMGLAHYAADVMELDDRWDLVVAHSLGSAVVLAAGLGTSHWTKRLVLQDLAILGSDDPDVVGWLLQEFDDPITSETIAASNPTWHIKDVELKAEDLMQCGPEAIHRTMEDNGSQNLWDELMAINVPTLLIGADPAFGALLPPPSQARPRGRPICTSGTKWLPASLILCTVMSTTLIGHS